VETLNPAQSNPIHSTAKVTKHTASDLLGRLQGQTDVGANAKLSSITLLSGLLNAHSTQRLRFGGSLADIVRSTNLLTYLLCYHTSCDVIAVVLKMAYRKPAVC